MHRVLRKRAHERAVQYQQERAWKKERILAAQEADIVRRVAAWKEGRPKAEDPLTGGPPKYLVELAML